MSGSLRVTVSAAAGPGDLQASVAPAGSPAQQTLPGGLPEAAATSHVTLRTSASFLSCSWRPRGVFRTEWLLTRRPGQPHPDAAPGLGRRARDWPEGPRGRNLAGRAGSWGALGVGRWPKAEAGCLSELHHHAYHPYGRPDDGRRVDEEPRGGRDKATQKTRRRGTGQGPTGQRPDVAELQHALHRMGTMMAEPQVGWGFSDASVRSPAPSRMPVRARRRRPGSLARGPGPRKEGSRPAQVA